jgi:hypothetical protein
VLYCTGLFCSSVNLSICLPRLFWILRCRCFTECRRLSSVTFEPDSQLSPLYESRFKNYASLRSVCIPSSLEAIHHDLLCCGHLSILSFEASSKLTRSTPELNLPSGRAGEELAIPDSVVIFLLSLEWPFEDLLVVHCGQETMHLC